MALLLLSLAAASLQLVPPDAYLRCVEAQTRQLERSGERPGDVGTAVVAACRPTLEQLLGQRDPPLSADVRAGVRDRVAQRARDQVIGEVVRIRAVRR